MTQSIKTYDIAIIGAGPAGLTAAYNLAKTGKSVFLIEKDPQYVGGLSKTYQYKGYYFDIGGHRFFTQISKVQSFWNEILPNDFLKRPRKSHIYYQGKFIRYPLSFINILSSLPVFECISIVSSYLYIKIFPSNHVTSYEDYIKKNFGPTLFNIFFKGYTEKVWGLPCHQISQDWATERIGKLTISKIIKEKIFRFYKKTEFKTLIDSFDYPKFGPGMFWEKCAEKYKGLGGELIMDAQVKKLELKKKWNISYQYDDKNYTIIADQVINSAPLKLTLDFFGAQISEKIKLLQDKIKYRNFIQVALILDAQDEITDTWQHIQDEKFLIGRIQNFKNWSPYLVPDPHKTCYGVEIFCDEGDKIWKLPEENLFELVRQELLEIGIIKKQKIYDYKVIKVPFAYPVYTLDYKDYIQTILKYLQENFPNFYTIGRNGCHQYNNQDHSSLSAFEVVEEILVNSSEKRKIHEKYRGNYLEESVNTDL